MLSRWQSTIVDAQGNVQPGAVLTIRNEPDQSLAQVYMSPSDQQPYPLGQVPADASGYAYFYAPAGLYRIQSQDLSIDWRHVPLGNLAAMDSDQLAGELGLGTAATRDVGTGANEVPANSNLGAAAYLPIATTSQAQELTNDATVITPKKLGDVILPTVSGSATFTHIDNQIVLTGIVPTLALEVGDVIEITGSVDNNRLHTVESITDNNTIIVNYEHRNGAGSLSLVDETANVTIKRIAKWFNAPVGLGQDWVDVLDFRSAQVSFTNDTNRLINTYIRHSSGSDVPDAFFVNGISLGRRTSGGRAGNYVSVPPGGVYINTLNNYGNVECWSELR